MGLFGEAIEFFELLIDAYGSPLSRNDDDDDYDEDIIDERHSHNRHYNQEKELQKQLANRLTALADKYQLGLSREEMTDLANVAIQTGDVDIVTSIMARAFELSDSYQRTKQKNKATKEQIKQIKKLIQHL